CARYSGTYKRVFDSW
nr:immunoglobulin heavy chain junction region [Macaca mulatta]